MITKDIIEKLEKERDESRKIRNECEERGLSDAQFFNGEVQAYKKILKWIKSKEAK